MTDAIQKVTMRQQSFRATVQQQHTDLVCSKVPVDWAKADASLTASMDDVNKQLGISQQNRQDITFAQAQGN
jgi:hypothetical protein